jgi:phospholipid/cholesterol/gamma-HCH transport system substrate-binding protein
MARRGVAEVATGAAVLVVAAGFLAYAIGHTGRSTGSGYTLTAHFDRIDGLVTGADVRLAGVKVGSVVGERIDPQNYVAIVTMRVDNGIVIPKDSSAEITSESLLGGKYIALVPGGDQAMLKDGQNIEITQSSVSLEQILGKFIFSVTQMVDAVKPGTTTATPAPKPP